MTKAGESFEKAVRAPKSQEEKDHDALVGKRIRKARILVGLTQQDLADKVGGMRFQQIQKYECGANAVSTYRLLQIAATLGRPITYFLPEKAELAPEPPKTAGVTATPS